MAFESLFSRPPNPALDKNMTDSEHAGDEREDGELEDGEIDDVGIEEEPSKTNETEVPVIEKSHRKSRKRRKKEKKKQKRSRRDKKKHDFPASDNSSENSYDSDTDNAERTHKEFEYRDYDSQFPQHGQLPGNYSTSPKAQLNKRSKTDFDDYTNYSDGNFNDEEQEDFIDQLKQYQQAKEELNAPDLPHKNLPMKAIQQGPEQKVKGPFFGRGRGMQKKLKRGRGRGLHKGQNTYFQDGFQEDTKPAKKWMNMSQDFINQHTVELKGKHICKYFLEARCIKGDQCKFDHNAEIQKKKEICKFYIQGYCTKGDNCIYMHNEFPCKFYHTGAKCYQGDNCKFSHDPLTDDTRELLHKVLNTEEEQQHEEENDTEELRRPKFYNPSFYGLQFQANQQMYNSEMQDPGHNAVPITRSPSHQTVTGYTNPSISSPLRTSSMQSPVFSNQNENSYASGPPFLQNAENNLHAMQQNSYPPLAFFTNYYSQQAVQNTQSSSPPESMNKGLLARTSNKTNGEEENPDQKSVSRDNEGIVNWYTSSEEDEESGVNSILKTLRNQSKLIRKNSTEQPVSANVDPRLTKDRVGGMPMSDPRMKPAQSPRNHADSACIDPRVSRDPRKTKPDEISPSCNARSDNLQPQSGSKVKNKALQEDEEDGERELRDKAVIIPLEMLPGVSLRDPRCKLRQFSHIKMDIILTKPNFAKLIVWAPEDLLPVPPPKPDPVSSINLPLPPLIADQRLNKTGNIIMEVHHSVSDPRLERLDPRLETKAKHTNIAVRCSFVDHTESHIISNKLGDPRLQKNLQSRLCRVLSTENQKDSNPLKIDPRVAAKSGFGLLQSTVVSKPDQDVLPPYAPKLSSSNIHLRTPSSILKNISLYDPKDNTISNSDTIPHKKEENEEELKKTETVNKPCKNEGEEMDSFQQPKCSTEIPQTKSIPVLEQSEECSTNGPAEETVNSNKSPSLTSIPQPPTAPAVHNLPIQALTGLIRPQYNEPRQIKSLGQVNQTQDVDIDDKTLKDVFKTFDPTASPFC